MFRSDEKQVAHTTREPLQHLALFCSGLLDAIARTDSPEKTRAAVQESLSGECVGCHIRVSGEELLKLVEGSEGETRPRLKRLRLGYCAREGCDSSFYSISCASHRELDWPKLLALQRTAEQEQVTSAEVELTGKRRTARKGFILRVSLGIAAVIVLFIIRQWYFGGTIPLLREPEKFEVNHGPLPGGTNP